MTKEEIYDEQVNPLMAQILAICKEHKIAMFASFSVPNEDDPDLMCTSCLLADDYEPPEQLLEAKRALFAKPSVIAMTITTR